MWWKKKKSIPPSFVLIQGSLQPHGLTDILLAEAVRFLGGYPVVVEMIDVRNRDIDFYDTRKPDEYAPSTKKIRYLSSVIFDMCRVAKGNLDFSIMDTTFLDFAAAQLAEQLDAAEYVATLLVTNDGHFGGIPALTTQAC